MDYTKIEQDGRNTVLLGIRNFDLTQILDCGQCFRWAGEGGSYTGIAHGRQMQLALEGDSLIFKDMSPREFDYIWKDYFDLGRDYGQIRKDYSADPALAKAVEFSPGLRVMRQDPWETLITFILSQNNNIPRIKKMVALLCEHFGEALPDVGQAARSSNISRSGEHAYLGTGSLPGGNHAFPTPGALAVLSAEDLAPIKPGYRAPYIIDAARQVAEGRLDIAQLQAQPSDDIQKALLGIHGVGPKVAECVLLFGFGKVERFPLDVWMKRVMAALYPKGFPEELKPTAGIAQQYLFHYARMLKMYSKRLSKS